MSIALHSMEDSEVGQRAHTIITQGQHCSLHQPQQSQQRLWCLFPRVKAGLSLPLTRPVSSGMCFR